MESRGISFQNDSFQANKLKKLYASKVFPKEFATKVDITQVSLDKMRGWIDKRITEILGHEDEIVSEYCVTQLESYDPVDRAVDPRGIQINLEGFLGEEGAATFVKELWLHLISAQKSPLGVPQVLLDEEKRAAEAKRAAEERLQREIEQNREQSRLEKEKDIVRRERERRTDHDKNYRRHDDHSSKYTRRRSRSRSRDAGRSYRRY